MTTETIAINRIVPNKKNPETRQRNIEALATTIKEVGLINNIKVIPVTAREDSYMVIAGHRRFAACIMLNWKEIPCSIYDGITLEQAEEIALIDNIEREDLTPMEQAQGLAQLMAREKKQGKEAVEAVAARLAKPVSWIRKRAKLMDLMGSWKKAAVENRMAAETLEAISRLDKVMQSDLYGEWAHALDTLTATIVNKWADKRLYRIKGAPWDATDETLVAKAGACASCPKRSSCQPELWDVQSPGKGHDMCLDPDCYDAKKVAWVARRAEEMKEKHGHMPTATWSGNPTDAVMVEGKPVTKCDKDHPDAKPCFIKEGDGAGHVVWYEVPTEEPQEEEPSNQPDRSDKIDHEEPNKQEETLEEKRAKLHVRREVAMIQAVAEMLKGNEGLSLSAGDCGKEGILRLIFRFGIGAGAGWDGEHGVFSEIVPAIERKLRQSMSDRLMVRREHEVQLLHARMTAAAWNIDMETLWENAVRDIPEPKEWTSGGSSKSERDILLEKIAKEEESVPRDESGKLKWTFIPGKDPAGEAHRIRHYKLMKKLEKLAN